jgi:hypothetical protein
VRLSRGQRTVVYLVTAAIALALAIGFWPVHADVFGEPSYNCGSGFIHNSRHWIADSEISSNERTGAETAKGTPRVVCPSKVLNHRDWALLLGAFALVLGVPALALMQGEQDRTSRAIFASMRIRRR